LLKQLFTELLTKYTGNSSLVNELWTEIEHHYSGKKRHYHTLQHLENLLQQLTTIKAALMDWDAVLFSLYYHDSIYNPLKKDNEEKSAALAEERMRQAAIPADITERCKATILATKAHGKSTDSDTDYFTDADLSVLGQDWETYSAYYKNVRKEYAVYPALIYNPGRKKVLQHFLSMERIFKTNFFYNKFEIPARQNLQREIALL
jgi:predicted metal-dependent HD superfamily phosphohydrolase